MSDSSTTTPTDMENTKHESPSTTNANLPIVVEDAVDAEVTPSTLPVATNAPATGKKAQVPTNATAAANVPEVVTDAVLPDPIVLPNYGVELALSAHRNG